MQMNLFMVYLLCSAAPPTGDFGENASLTAKSPDRVSVFQTARDDSTVTPQKPSSCIENALHKDVFGVISGTGKPPFLHSFGGSRNKPNDMPNTHCMIGFLLSKRNKTTKIFTVFSERSLLSKTKTMHIHCKFTLALNKCFT